MWYSLSDGALTRLRVDGTVFWFQCLRERIQQSTWSRKQYCQNDDYGVSVSGDDLVKSLQLTLGRSPICGLHDHRFS